MKGLHNVFKKVSGGAKSVFKKTQDISEDVFKKGAGVVNAIKEQGPGIAKQISEGAGSVSDVLNKVSKISGKIASNPITASIPLVGGAIATGAGALSSASRLGAMGTKQLSEATNLANYKRGGVSAQLENIKDIQRRGREIADTANQAGSLFA